MIINDKALARVLKRSGKAGFKFCVNGNAIRLVSWDWAARLPIQSSGTENRQTLAALVEMLGYLPGDGECGHVYRDGGEWYSIIRRRATMSIFIRIASTSGGRPRPSCLVRQRSLCNENIQMPRLRRENHIHPDTERQLYALQCRTRILQGDAWGKGPCRDTRRRRSCRNY